MSRFQFAGRIRRKGKTKGKLHVVVGLTAWSAGPRGHRPTETWRAGRHAVLPGEERRDGVQAGEGRLDGVIGWVCGGGG